MRQRYVYSTNLFRNLTLGVFNLDLMRIGATHVTATGSSRPGNFIWRNAYLDGYKIGEGFEDRPTELSNFLLVRTRSSILMQNRVSGKLTNTSGYLAPLRNNLYESAFQSALKSVRTELVSGMEALHRVFVIENKKASYPVAFATNAMYVLAREDGVSSVSRDIIEQTLLPVIKEKAEYLHAEGVSSLAYALDKYQIHDEEAWDLVKLHTPAHSFDTEYVKNDRWSL